MEIKKHLTKVNRTIASNRSIKYIVIHYVGAVSTAKNNALYFEKVNRYASAHYFVDENDIYQIVEDKNISWHCGAYNYYCGARNSNSIGIEMCCYKNNGKLDIKESVVNRTIELTKELMKKYNIPASNVVRHYDVTHKICPAPFVKDISRWNNFKAKLSNTKPSTKNRYTGVFPTLPSRGYFYYDNKNKKIKDTGTQVKNLQRLLNWLVNAGLVVDGYCGVATRNAILKFQKTYNLTQDGFFGKQGLNKAKTIEK